MNHGKSRVAPLLALILVVSGCASVSGPDRRPVASHPIPRCYSAPVAPLPDAARGPAVSLSTGPDGVIVGDPVDRAAQAQARIDGAVVQVVNNTRSGTHHGSGFITTNSHGDQVVVSSAHVVADPRFP